RLSTPPWSGDRARWRRRRRPRSPRPAHATSSRLPPNAARRSALLDPQAEHTGPAQGEPASAGATQTCLLFPLPLREREGAREAGGGGGLPPLARVHGKLLCGENPLTLPLLRNGPLPLPQGERGFTNTGVRPIFAVATARRRRMEPRQTAFLF